MIQANELRIGNYILHENKPRIIDTIYYDSVNVDFNGSDGYELKELQPITITEEILLKCGFEYKHTNFLHNDSTLEWYFGLTGMFLPSIYKHTIKSDNIKGVRYLHQLQNLYYALTGQELEINL